MMSDKSYVTLEQRLCIVCGHPYDSGSLLLHQRLKPVFDRKTVTGWGICDEHKKMRDAGFVALVELSNAYVAGTTITPNNASRTGVFMHMKKEIFKEVFDTKIDEQMVVFIEPEVTEKIKKLYKQDTGEDLESKEEAVAKSE